MTTETKKDLLKESSTFGSFSVDDLEKAKAFYGETLGLDVKEPGGVGLSLELHGGGRFFIYGKPNHEPASFTVLNFKVPNIDAAVDELSERGVTFEQYDKPMKTDEKGICRAENGGHAIAWFKDPAGNVLSVMQE